MSGGVGPTGSDISLPQKQEVDHKEQQEQHSLKNLHKTITTTPHKPTFLSFRHLNCLAVVVVLSATGMVAPEDFAFVLFSIIYMYFLSKMAFPSLPPSKEEPLVFNPKNKLLALYVFLGAIIGLYAPIAYILEGIFEGDKEGIKAAAPHVFLLSSQVFMEGVAFSGRFSTPMRAFVPVFYNSRRIFTIVDWLRSEIKKVNEVHSGSDRRIFVGRVLAVANMAFWCFNLFGFLLPVYLPKVFRLYYAGHKD